VTVSWLHNAILSQWELRDRDIMYDRDDLLAFVTDELIEKTAVPEMIAVHLRRKIGTVPPPLREYLPQP
jgi:hypothetical protein